MASLGSICVSVEWIIPQSEETTPQNIPQLLIICLSKVPQKSQLSHKARHMPTAAMSDKNRQIRKKMEKRVFRGGQQQSSGI